MDEVMAEAAYANNHIVDETTGFIENPAFVNNFDSERKQAFLKNYRTNGLRLRRACRSMGLSESTVSRHLQVDPVFRAAFEDVERDFMEDLEATSKECALNPKQYVERIFLLKCLLPEKYGQENKPIIANVTLNVEGNSLEHALNKSNILEAEIVNSPTIEDRS